MAPLVVEGAMLLCDMGTVPCPLVVIPTGPPVTAGPLAATVMDHMPMANIATFAVCRAPGNPAAKNPTGQGPCVPQTATPWTPGSPTVTINGQPALTADSTCMCAFGGTVTITFPGQVTVEVAG